MGRRPKMLLETRGYVDDDPGYSCALVIPTRSEDWEWAELFLENVNERAEGDKRIAKARVIVRIWVGEEHYDFLYTDAVSQLERARALLLEGETSVPPE